MPTKRKKKKSVQDIVEDCCQEISDLEPTYEEIDAFVEKVEKEGWSYGIVTYTKRDDNPLNIRFHDTRRQKGHFGGRIHVDIISGEFHLMLDKDVAPEFIDFIKNKRSKRAKP